MERWDAAAAGSVRGSGQTTVTWLVALGIVLALVASILTGAGLPSASAAVPANPVPTVTLPPQIDIVDDYQGQSLCNPSPRAGTSQLRDTLWKTYGRDLWAGISRDCNVTWDQGISEHKDGRAIDWGVHVRKESKAIGDAFAEWAIANNGENARRMGIMYIIWDSAMWRLYDMDRGWSEYRSCKSKYTSSSYDTTCHRDHMHISMTWHGAGAWTSWYDGTAVTQQACRAGDPIKADPGTPGAPRVLFDPLGGVGVPGGKPCYLGSSIQTLRLPVADGRLTAQKIRVTHVHANAPSPVRIWTSTGSEVQLRHTSTASEHSLRLGGDGLLYIQAPVGQAGIRVEGIGQTLLASAVSGGNELAVPVAGGSTGVPGDAEAISLNVTVTQPRGPGYLTVYPCGAGRPGTSNVNFTAGQTIANAVVVGVGSKGRVCIYASATAHVVVDYAGYFPAGSPFTPTKPQRLTDTRTSAGKPSAGSDTAVQLPSGAAAGALMVTVADPAARGWVSAYPCGTAWPGTSTVNFAPGQTVAGGAIVPAGADRKVCVRTSTDAHIIVDLMGTIGAGKGFAPATPTRLADTRARGGAALQPFAELAVPTDPAAPAVVLNLTATDGGSPGWIQAYPCGTKPRTDLQPQLRQRADDRQRGHREVRRRQGLRPLQHPGSRRRRSERRPGQRLPACRASANRRYPQSLAAAGRQPGSSPRPNAGHCMDPPGTFVLWHGEAVASRVLVAIPAWNEAATVAAVIREVRDHAPDCEIVVLDDGSQDETAEQAAAAGATVLTMPRHVGVGAAMRSAFRFARQHGYDRVVQVDADGQHDPKYIPDILQALDRSSVVIGARFADAADAPAYTVGGPRRWAMWTLARGLSQMTGTTSDRRHQRVPRLGRPRHRPVLAALPL